MARLKELVALYYLLIAANGKTVFPPVSTNCTESASKSVSWRIQNFTLDTDTEYDFGPGTVGKVSFSIQNTANGYAFDCLQGDGSTGRAPNRRLVDGNVWYSCNVYCQGARDEPDEDDPPLSTSFHFDMGTKSLSISQTWSCSGWNRSVPTNYTGLGTGLLSDLSCAPIPGGRPDQVACRPIDTTIKASNVSIAVPSSSGDEGPDDDPYANGAPLDNPFSPQFYPKPGVTATTPGCNELSLSPSYKVSDFFWSVGGVAFTLTNSALNYTQRCNIGGTGEFVGQLRNPSWWNCTRFDSLHVNYPANEVYTSLLYGGNKNVLGINQTWYCNDDNATEATVYSAYGEAHFPLKCNETRYCMAASKYDYDKRPQKIVNDLCSADDLVITPSHTNTSHLSKEAAIEEFKPHGYNCSDKSLKAAGTYVWDIASFTFNKTYVPGNPAVNSTASYTNLLEFYYNNTATDNDWPRNTGWRQCFYITDESTGDLDGVKQLQCYMSFEPFTLGFKFNNETSMLSLNQEWTCDGVDSQHTNYFEAFGSVQLPLQCQSVGNDTQCAAKDPFTVPIANISSRLNYS